MALGYEVQGFLTYWVPDFTSLNYNLISTINWFSLEPNADGSLNTQTGYPPSGLITKAHSVGVRVNLVVQTFDNTIQDSILANPTAQANLLNNALAAVQQNGFDGIDFDFELMTTNNSNGQSNRTLFTNFMQAVYAKFHGANPNYQIMLDLPPVDWNNIFDVAVLQNLVTYMEIMGYDFHWQGGPTAGAVAPLENGTAPSVHNAMSNYVSLVNPSKLLLGVPYYGYVWPTVTDQPESATTGAGVSETYDQAIAHAATYGRKWDPLSQTPYYTYQIGSQWYQGWYEDAQSLAAKYALVKSMGLRGISIWALNYDSGRTELWDLINTNFTGGGGGGACSFTYAQI